MCINYRHSVTLQLHKVKVVISFIFKKRTVKTQMYIKHKVWWNTNSLRSVGQYGRSYLLHFKYIRFDSNLYDIRSRWGLKITSPWVWLATPAASQQRKKIFFLATRILLQVPIPVPVLKVQVSVQVPVLCTQVPMLVCLQGPYYKRILVFAACGVLMIYISKAFTDLSFYKQYGEG